MLVWIGGIRTNISLQKRLLDLREVRDGSMATRTVVNLLGADRATRATRN